jgi:hypothetical protein
MKRITKEEALNYIVEKYPLYRSKSGQFLSYLFIPIFMGIAFWLWNREITWIVWIDALVAGILLLVNSKRIMGNLIRGPRILFCDSLGSLTMSLNIAFLTGFFIYKARGSATIGIELAFSFGVMIMEMGFTCLVMRILIRRALHKVKERPKAAFIPSLSQFLVVLSIITSRVILPKHTYEQQQYILAAFTLLIGFMTSTLAVSRSLLYYLYVRYYLDTISPFPKVQKHSKRLGKGKQEPAEESTWELYMIIRLIKPFNAKVLQLNIAQLSLGNILLIVELRQLQLRLISDCGYNSFQVRDIGKSVWKEDWIILPNALLMGSFNAFAKEVLRRKAT